MAPWRLHDAARYQAGLSWDDTLMQLAAQAIRGASPLLEQARPLLEKATPFVKLVTEEGTERTVSGIGDRPNFDTATPPHLFEVSMPEPARMTADAVPLAGDAVGPTGFLERLSWYRGLLTDTLAAGTPSGEPQRHLYGLVTDFIDRSGKGASGAVHRDRARLGRSDGGRFPRRGGHRNAAQRLPWCMTTSRTAATRGAAWQRCIVVSEYRSP
jgi:hypothetical protein